MYLGQMFSFDFLEPAENEELEELVESNDVEIDKHVSYYDSHYDDEQYQDY